MKSLRLKSRKHTKSHKHSKGGNGPSSSSSATSENYTNENIDKLIHLLSQFAVMSDEDINNNTQKYKDERAETIKDIKYILNNPNFNISLLPKYSTAALLTAIVSANEEIIDLYANLYATKENPPEIDDVLTRVTLMFEMNAEPYDDDDDDDDDYIITDSDRENKEKGASMAQKRYDKLIRIIKKMKGKRKRNDADDDNDNNKYSRNEDTDDNDYNNDDNDVDMTGLDTVFSSLKTKGGRRRTRKLRTRKLRTRKLRKSNRRK
jgi:hypothetical protein